VEKTGKTQKGGRDASREIKNALKNKTKGERGENYRRNKKSGGKSKMMNHDSERKKKNVEHRKKNMRRTKKEKKNKLLRELSKTPYNEKKKDIPERRARQVDEGEPQGGSSELKYKTMQGGKYQGGVGRVLGG